MVGETEVVIFKDSVGVTPIASKETLDLILMCSRETSSFLVRLVIRLRLCLHQSRN